jgi:hypothetical protein
MITNYVQCRLVLINMYLLTGLSQNPKKRAYIERALQIKFTTKKKSNYIVFLWFSSFVNCISLFLKTISYLY